MRLLVDAHLPPSLAPWIKETFNIDAYSFDYLGWRFKDDHVVFVLAKEEKDSVVITKDQDFVNLVQKYKSPPKVIWITCGNTRKDTLKKLLLKLLPSALELLNDNDLVEING